METFPILLNSSVSRRTVNGKEYLIAQGTLIVPGILNGSRGPLYYPKEEISRDYTAWNGMPIVANHPEKNGVHVSGRNPDVLESQGLGTVYNTNIDNTGKLNAELWFDVEAVRKYDRHLPIGTKILPRLESSKQIEVSTGLFTDNEEVANGSYQGKSYTHIAKNYRPDHLAVLPTQVGACSVNDGCGINVNSDSLLTSFWNWLTDNAGRFGNPQSTATGKFKKHGAGTGKGLVHEAAQRGAISLTADDITQGSDAKTQADAGHNPASWVSDEATWDRAKAEASKGYDEGSDEYWAVVTHIYKKMGGEVFDRTGAVKSTTKNVFCATGEGGGVDPSCGSGGDSSSKEKADDITHAKGVRAAKDLGGQVQQKLVDKADKVLAKAGVISQERTIPKNDAKFISKLYENTRPVKGDTFIQGKVRAEVVAIEKTPTGGTSIDLNVIGTKGGRVTTVYVNKEWIENANPEGCNQYKDCGTVSELHEKADKGSVSDVRANAEKLVSGMSKDQLLNEMKSLGFTPSGSEKSSAKKMKDRIINHMVEMAATGEQVRSVDKIFKVTSNIEGTDMTRKELIQYLTTNCDCWKNKQGGLANEDMFTDDDLKNLKANADKGKQLQLTANVFSEIAKTLEIPEGMELNAVPAFIKEKMKEDPEEEDDDDEDEGKKKYTKNQKNQKVPPMETPKKMTMKEMLANASPEEQSVWNNAVEIERRERQRLVGLLTANVAENKKQDIAKKLVSKPLHELRDMLELLPTSNNSNAQDYIREVPNYSGAAGGIPFGLTDNEQGDVLDLEAERQKYDHVVNAKKQKIS